MNLIIIIALLITYYNVQITIEDTKMGSDDIYEIAVLDKSGELDYSTHITEDTIRDLTQDEVTEYMIKIQQL